MELSVSLTLLVAGFALVALVVGAVVTVERALALGGRYDVPDSLLALSVVVATGLPEIAAHLGASAGILSKSLFYETASAAVLGANVGASTVQQFLLVGVVLVASASRLTVSKSFLRADYAAMLVSFGLLYILALDGVLSRFDGLVLVIAFAGYVAVRYVGGERGHVPNGPASENAFLDAALAVVGVVTVLLSAFVILELIDRFVVARDLGGSTVGLVTIGLGAALPELSSALEAARRDRTELALGTLVGSNVVNFLLAAGLGAAISTYRVPTVVVAWDLPFKLIAGLALLVYLRFVSDRTLGRPAGYLLVGAYLAYVGGRLVLYASQ